MLKIAMNDVTHVNTFIQYGGLAAVTGDPAIVARMSADDAAKRDLIVGRLRQMRGVRCAEPEGTIYAFPNIEGTGLDSTTLAIRLLEEASVVVEDGAFYGSAGRGHLRVCFGSQTTERLEEAAERMTRFFARLAP